MAYALASKSKGATPATVAPVRRHQRRRHAGPAGNARGAGDLARPRIAASAPMPFLQPKLEVGAPNDRFEQEAERVAEQVMRMPASATPPAVSTAAGRARRSIQRIRAECAEEEAAPLLRKPLPNAASARICARSDAIVAPSVVSDQAAIMQRQELEEDETLQTKTAAGAAPEVAPGVEAGIHALRGRGRPLSAAERAFFEPRLGHDFSQVRLHTGARATALARAVEARAFTVGTDIVFEAGQYAQGSEVGKKLLAHELTHTVQQGDNGLVQRLTISPIVNKINPSWTCGQHMRHWKFELSNPAPAEGYMVQEIDYRLNLQGCPNSALGKFELKTFLGGVATYQRQQLRCQLQELYRSVIQATGPWKDRPGEKLRHGQVFPEVGNRRSGQGLEHERSADVTGSPRVEGADTSLLVERSSRRGAGDKRSRGGLAMLRPPHRFQQTLRETMTFSFNESTAALNKSA